MAYQRKREARRTGGVISTRGNGGRVGWPVEAWQNEYTPAVAEFMARYEGPASARSVCIYLNISPATFYDWLGTVPEFRETIEMHRGIADDAVQDAMHKRATGYSQDTQKVARKVMHVPLMDSDGEPIEGETKEIELERKITTETVHVAPDTHAGKFWLTNRRREEWAERKIIESADYAGMVERFFNEMQDVTPEEDD